FHKIRVQLFFLGGCRVMGFVARRVGNRAHFFDLLRRIVVLRNEKDRKNEPVSHRRSRIISSRTAS
ncbi:MAG: hypothetical protein KAR12_02795, partial [Methylococcales bacterium]|nr:hypothetical protein [Methylococcales bacterium]